MLNGQGKIRIKYGRGSSFCSPTGIYYLGNRFSYNHIKMFHSSFTLSCSISFLLLFIGFLSQAQMIETTRVYDVERAHQAVVADQDHFYVINNSEIVKYDLESGIRVDKWQDTTGRIRHLNSGVMVDGKLYCANSNFPQAPMASSIEVFDPVRMEPAGSHSLGIDIGSATWLDWYEGYWYVVFAHYSGNGGEPGKTNQWTQLVKFTPDWQRVGGWIFPEELLERFGNYSNSGGVILSDGTILGTGHDEKELYLLSFPSQGYTLEWTGTVPAPFEGQGIAKDLDDPRVLYGISRKNDQVIVGRWVATNYKDR